MGRYRKIDTKIWNDENFQAFSDDGKLAFLFLLTHPHMTAIGAMRTTIPGLAAELGWPLKRFRAAIQSPLSKGMIELNEQACYLALPKFLRYNEPEGPNSVTKAWPQALNLIPECPEKTTLITRCQTYLNGRSDAFRHAIGDAMQDAIGDAKSKPCPIQEQEPEQEPEKRAGSSSPSPAGRSTGKRQVQLTDGEFIDELRRNPAYRHLDIDMELGKLQAWLKTPRGRGKANTRQRFVAWLNRAADEQRPMMTGPAPSNARHCQDRQSNGRHSKPCPNPCVVGEAYCSVHLPVRQRIAAHLANGSAS
jgi:hypothetical protein